MRSTQLICSFMILLLAATSFNSTGAYDPLDPTGNITITWDIMSWTYDGYMAMVTIRNFQMYRHISPPGWQLGWTWARKEVVWDVWGAEVLQQGDCSSFKGNIPHSCMKDPSFVDLPHGAPYNHRVSNCCRDGLLSSWGQDHASSLAQFQVSIGQAGTSNQTIRMPHNFTLLGPGPGYTCGPAEMVTPNRFAVRGSRRQSQAFVTWSVTCTYSQFRARRTPACCVSLSAFYSPTIVECPTCACGCGPNMNCTNSPLVCTEHMCPVRVHWHIKTSYKGYWRVRITLTNLNRFVNFTDWTLVVQHPSLNKITQVFSFNYKSIVPYEARNDSGMFYGLENFNNILVEAGNVQSEMLMEKDPGSFTFKQGWGFPRRVLFDGDECVLPPPDAYPGLPSSAYVASVPAVLSLLSAMAMTMVLL